MVSSSCVFFAVMAWVDAATPEQVQEKGKVVQQMKIEAPAMTEEDHYGYSMPDQYKCDACRGVMYHLNSALTAKQPKSRRLQEWEYQDIFDETCAVGFKGYGVKLIDGKNVLSGPGLTHEEKLQPGMGAIQMGGEKWEKRMGEICRKLVYETIGEDKLYESFYSTGKLSESLCQESTRVCHKPIPKKDADKLGRRPKQAKETVNNPKKGKPVKSVKNGETVGSSKSKGIDFTTFLNQLAKEHGLPADAYTTKRSRKEWEKTLLQVAGHLYTTSASDESVTKV